MREEEQTMEHFMTHDFTITETVLCAEVRNGTPIHRNRKSHGLVFYPAGSCTFSFLDGRTVKAEANTVVYLPKGSDYNVTSKKGNTPCYAINFQIDFDGAFSPFCVRVKNHSGILQLFREADKYFMNAAAGYKMKCKSCLCEIISIIQYEYSLGYVSGEKRDVIAPAVEKIHTCYTEESLKVSSLASLCGITPEYFRSIFGKVYGVSPSKYIESLRMARGAELLSSGMYSVGETARMCGYEDAAYFSREFRKYKGIAPRDYVKQAELMKL